MAAGVEDMTTLSTLTEESILENLRIRYDKQFIYTYTGSILVALNPYKTLDIYDSKSVKAYTGKRMNEMPPHIFAISETAYANVRSFKENQAIIISGESGAGKSESTKVILQYLTAVSAQEGEDSKSWIEQQILEASTVLESFGNAKTVRNNNSSRFGKFVQVLMNGQQQIIGASIVNYLLEKSRVVRQANSERNYHAFYELVSGANPEEREKYKLLPEMKSYYYLNQSGCIEIPGVNDKKHFEALKLAFTVLKVSSDDLQSIMKALSSILRLGNVQFSGDEAVEVKSKEDVEVIAGLLQCDLKKLTTSLTFRKIVVRTDTTMVPLKKDQALDNRDSIAKTIYDKMFNYIVDYINISMATKDKPANFIGVLDIFGFELFEINSFEQLCINYTNEKLQQFFNQFIFKLEQEEYKREGISVESIVYKDNQPTLDLIEGKTGILALLDEECRVPKGTDETLLGKLFDSHGKHENFVKPKTAKGQFGIKHYAGEVPYMVVNFLDKNRDAVQDDIYELFQTSQNPLMQKLFKRVDASADKNATMGAKKAAATAGANFKAQLMTLVTTLGSTTPHYVRCVKSNPEKKAFVFDPNLVIVQLRYAGMLETIRIRKSGYPMRFAYEFFNHRFRFLSKTVVGDAKATCAAIFNAAKIDKALWQTGSSKIFMKQTCFDTLTIANDKIASKMVIIVQKLARRFIARRRFVKQRKAAMFLQKFLKMFIYRLRYKRSQKRIVIVQSVIRRWFAQDYFKGLKAEKKAKEAAEKKAIEDAAKKIADEERQKAGGAAAKAAADEDAQEAAKKSAEEKNLASYASKITKPGKEGDAGLDSLFSFLGEFDEGAAKKAAGSLVQKEDFDDIFKLEDTDASPTKVAAASSIAATKENKPPAVAEPKAPEAPRLKSNPLARKVNAPEEDLTLFSIRAFAEKNFEKHMKAASGGLTFKKSAKTSQTIDEMLCYSKNPLQMSLVKFPPGSEKQLVDIALDCFKTLNKIIEPGAKKQLEMLENAKKLLDVGLKKPEIRDELYVQICKQLTPPTPALKGWEEVEANGWHMLCMYCGCFPPSKNFSKYFQAFLTTKVEEHKAGKLSSDVAKYVLYADMTVKKTLINGPRKMLPSIMEIQAVKTQQPILCRFYLMDGQVKACGVTAVTTASDIVRDLSNRIDLKDPAGWSIFEVQEEPWEEHVLKNSEYIADILSFWETSKKSSMQMTGYETMRKKPKAGAAIAASQAAIGDGDTKLYMKKRIFKKVGEIPSDPVEFNLVYAQAAVDVAHDVYPMNEKTALMLAALKAQVDWGNFETGAKNRFENLKSFIPASLFPNQKEDQWIKNIGELQQKLSGKNPIQARLLYLEALKQFKYFGSTLFAVKFKGFWPHPENVILAVSSGGIAILLRNKTIIEGFSYKQILSWDVEGDVITLQVRKITPAKENVPASERTEEMKFQSKVMEDLSSLIKDYSPRIGSEKKNKDVYFATESEIAFFLKDLEKSRFNLIKKKIVTLPQIATGAAAAAPGGKAKLGSLFPSAPAAAKAPTSGPEVTDLQAQEAAANWSVVMSAIPGVILNVFADSPSSAAIAATLPATLAELAAQGAKAPMTGNETMSRKSSNASDTLNRSSAQLPLGTTQSPVVATLLQKCFGLPKVFDEVYMQLCKLTTDHPEVDGKAVLQYWKILAIMSGFMKPAIPEVLEYVKAHFKRYSVLDGKEHIAKMRKEEAKHAKFCYKALQRCLLTDVRSIPPSQDEINMVMRLNPVVTRFYLPDGQFRAITCDASSTLEEMMSTVKEKLNLTSIAGFALYEVIEKSERHLDFKEKICDLMAYGESMVKSGFAKEKPKLLLKKRLFFNPNTPSPNEMDENFLLYQAVDDIMAGKFPLTEADAVYFAALRTQLESGDVAPGKEVDYKKIAEKYIPKDLRTDKAIKDLAAEHGSLRGKSGADCNKLFMLRIRTWGYYGSSVYFVQQSYTNDLPNQCWLLVNQKGVHIAPKNSKTTLATYTFKDLLSVNPDIQSIMIVTEKVKYVFETTLANEIAILIKDYQDEPAKAKMAADAANKRINAMK